MEVPNLPSGPQQEVIIQHIIAALYLERREIRLIEQGIESIVVAAKDFLELCGSEQHRLLSRLLGRHNIFRHKHDSLSRVFSFRFNLIIQKFLRFGNSFDCSEQKKAPAEGLDDQLTSTRGP